MKRFTKTPKHWGVMMLFCSLVGAILSPYRAVCQVATSHRADSVWLSRVVYLTTNLDSLTRVWERKGFAVERGAFDPRGVSSNIITLPSGQSIVLETTYTSDTNDWRYRALHAYGTHASGLIFAVPSRFVLAEDMRTLQIQHTDSGMGTVVLPNDSQSTMSYFAIGNPSPLDVLISTAFPAVASSQPMPNGLRKITWIILTVSDSTEALVRGMFRDLGIETHHAGCCDYWMVGPAENRIGLRFELPSTTFRGVGRWLSIEENGIVFD